MQVYVYHVLSFGTKQRVTPTACMIRLALVPLSVRTVAVFLKTGTSNQDPQQIWQLLVC